MNKRELEREQRRRDRLKAWIVYDPFVVGSGWDACVKSFDDYGKADEWLHDMKGQEPDGYDGCEVVPKDEFIKNNLVIL